jgi:hypothetical protein
MILKKEIQNENKKLQALNIEKMLFIKKLKKLREEEKFPHPNHFHIYHF